MTDFSELTLAVEIAFGIPTLVFVWLTWASGYVRMLVRAARRNRWGLSLISEGRFPSVGDNGKDNLEGFG